MVGIVDHQYAIQNQTVMLMVELVKCAMKIKLDALISAYTAYLYQLTVLLKHQRLLLN